MRDRWLDYIAGKCGKNASQRGEEKPLKIRDHGPDAYRYFAKTQVPYWRLAWDGK